MIGTRQFQRMDASQSNGASAPPAEERAAAGGNLVEGDPLVSSRTPQASVQTAQNIAQGDNATPLETGLRQRGNVESQRRPTPRRPVTHRWPPPTGKGDRSNLKLLRSSWTAWEQAWICYLWNR